MFDSAIIEVSIGLAFLFLMLSTICSGVYEFIAQIFSTRAKNLKSTIAQMIGDEKLADQFFDHPVIRNLSTKSFFDSSKDGKAGPTYIPRELFSRVLLSLVPTVAGAVPAVDSVRAVIEKADIDPGTRKMLLFHLNQAGGELKKGIESIEQWFDHGMDQLKALYKRRAQVWLIAIATLVAILLNVDIGLVASTLWRDPTLRASVVAQAEAAAKAEAPAKASTVVDRKKLAEMKDGLAKLELPIFWPTNLRDPVDERALPRDATGWVYRILGYLLAIAAMSLGAPFWFDTLNKLVNLRSSGKVPASGDAKA
jgi:hypothetical protein